MERTFSPMIRQYSAIDGLQQAYTLVYAMEVEGTQGCRLTLCQIGSCLLYTSPSPRDS